MGMSMESHLSTFASNFQDREYIIHVSVLLFLETIPPPSLPLVHYSTFSELVVYTPLLIPETKQAYNKRRRRRRRRRRKKRRSGKIVMYHEVSKFETIDAAHG